MAGPTAREGARHLLVVGAAEPAQSRLDSYVARALDLSRTQSATLIATGHVLVNG